NSSGGDCQKGTANRFNLQVMFLLGVLPASAARKSAANAEPCAFGLRLVHLYSTNFFSAETLRNVGCTSDNGFRNVGLRSIKSHSLDGVISRSDSKYFW